MTDGNGMSTISSTLFSHCKHERRACGKFGCLTPLEGSTLHRRIKDRLGAGSCTMLSQTVGKGADEFMESELESGGDLLVETREEKRIK
jgi:hypothetical protein